MAEQKNKRNLIRERDIEALRHVLSTELGRWFFYRLLDRSNLTGTSFTGNSQTYFNEGRRSIGIMLTNDVNKLGLEGLDKYQLAQREFVSKQIELKEMDGK